MKNKTKLNESESHRRNERGDVMVMTSVFIVFLMVSFWALMSASQQWNTRRDVQAVAAAAARAAAQGDPASIREGVPIDPARAEDRAQMILNGAGFVGSVSVDGLEVTVVVTGPIDYSFPSPGFPDAVTATARARLTRGINGTEGT